MMMMDDDKALHLHFTIPRFKGEACVDRLLRIYYGKHIVTIFLCS